MNALYKSEPAGARVMPSCRKQDAAICFLGASQIFSDTVLRTVDAEVTPATCLRLDDFETLLEELQSDGRIEDRGALCSLIVDEDHADGLVALAERREPLLSRVKLIVAIEDEAYAQELMTRHSAAILSNHISLLPMNVNLTTWLLILRMIVSGGHYIPPALLRCRPADPPMSALNGSAAANASHAIDVSGLTPRETEVLEMLASGQPNKIIAGQLNLSEHTVKLHIHRIIGKLGVTNRTEAAIRYHRSRSA